MVVILFSIYFAYVFADEINDADVFSLWERGLDANQIKNAVMADGMITTAEILGAADIVLELKYKLKAEQSKTQSNPVLLKRLRIEVESYDKLYHQLLEIAD